MTIGQCELCDMREDREVYTSKDDKNVTHVLCADHGGVEKAIGDSTILAMLSAIGAQPTPDGLDLPASFFDHEGNLKMPPWQYGETLVDLVADQKRKQIRIMMPVSSMRALSFAEVTHLLKLTGAIKGLYEHIVPEGWQVIA